MPLELRELIIQARIDPSASTDPLEPARKLSPEERQEIIEAVLERLEERLADRHQR